MKTSILACTLVLLLLVGLVGCGEKTENPDFVTRFHVEVSPNLPSKWNATATLPLSKVNIHFNPQPFIFEGDIIGADAYQTDLGKVVQIQFTPEAAQALWRVSASNVGKRIFMFVNGKPIGHHRIERAITSPQVFFWVEVPDNQVEPFVAMLKESIERSQALKKKQS